VRSLKGGEREKAYLTVTVDICLTDHFFNFLVR
jgi:hypothetical protein